VVQHVGLATPAFGVGVNQPWRVLDRATKQQLNIATAKRIPRISERRDAWNPRPDNSTHGTHAVAVQDKSMTSPTYGASTSTTHARQVQFAMQVPF